MKTEALRQLQSLLNHLIDSDPIHQSHLKKLAGRIAVFKVQPFNIQLNCLFSAQSIEFLDKLYMPPNVSIEGTPLAFLSMNFSRNPLSELFAGKVKISGDIDTAQKIQDLFKNLNIDWEEQLAKVTGDPIAYHIGKAVRKGRSIANKIFNTVQLNVTEYLQEEIQLLPPKILINDFLNDVDMLRNDVERLSARIHWLKEEVKH